MKLKVTNPVCTETVLEKAFNIAIGLTFCNVTIANG